MRGIYWALMPDNAAINALNASHPLAEFYWSGVTELHCIHQAIDNTRRHAYSHHIQRLMLTDNSALLAGVAPAEIEQWYLAIYADGFEWMEMPNTLGMAVCAMAEVWPQSLMQPLAHIPIGCRTSARTALMTSS